MTRMLATTAVALTLMTSALMTQAVQADEHRGGDAALGALSGAVVLGPVGAVAGAVVGYTAGPSIARSWGFRRSRTARAQQLRRPVRESQAAMTESPQPSQAVPRSVAQQPRTAAAAPPAPRGPVAPPVQTLE